MKKKLVMFGYTMEIGGAERALVNVLNVMVNYFDIDLILIKDEGPLMKDIPESVNVYAIRKNIIKYILFRYIPIFRKKIINKIANKKYDIAVAFMEGRAATWLIDLKQNCKKIAWIHNDVNKFDIGISTKEIKNTYAKVDEIIVVSKQSKESFCNKYQIDSQKVQVIYNLIDEEDILKKADEFKVQKDLFTFVNVAKMRLQKRHDRLLEAVYTLKKEGYKFKLWLVGDGPLEDKIKKQIEDLQIADYVKLWGLQENPFPYIKNADFFVMSSEHEGYPLSLLESLLLKTPVLTTDVSGADEILNKDKYGIICENNQEGLTNGMRLVLDKKKFPKISENLKKYKGSNAQIEEQLKQTFEIKM